MLLSSRSFALWTKCFVNLSGQYKKVYLKFFFLHVPEDRHQLIATVRETLLQHFLKSIMSWETVTTHHKHSFDGETPLFIGWKLSQNNQHLILYPFFLIHFMLVNDTLSTMKLGIKNYAIGNPVGPWKVFHQKLWG